MTDDTQNLARTEETTTQINTTELEYPQLLIEASFESLLSHSHSSADQSIGQTPTPRMSLSESWSSLSEHDLSHDDDLQSEATDTGSLIDISTAEDVHSINDQGDTSEGEEDRYIESGEDEGSVHNAGSRALGSSYGEEIPSYSRGGPVSQDCIRLDRSVESTDADGVISLQASKALTQTDLRLRSIHSPSWSGLAKLRGTIKMTLSEEGFQLGQRPFYVLYHGPSLSPPGVKSDVLGKIGAALIASDNHHDYDERPETPCYHIVPSEFGPGSRPSTADLIPIPVQMHVSDCVILDQEPEQSLDSSIHIQLGAGTTVVSRRATLQDTRPKSQWSSPDLIVIVTGHHQSAEDTNKASRVLEFAERHHIASVCLRHGSGQNEDDFLADANPDMLHEYQEHVSPSETADTIGHRMLVDVETFLALDSEQLNRHFQHLTALAKRKAQTNKSCGGQSMLRTLGAYSQTVKTCLERIPGVAANKRQGQALTGDWIVEASPTDDSYSKQSKPLGKSLTPAETPRKGRVAGSMFYQAGVTIMLAMITTFVMYACTSVVPHVLRAQTTVGSGASPSSVISAFSETTAAAAAATSPTYALSGPLQVLEQQVHNWMPSRCSQSQKALQQKRVGIRTDNHKTVSTTTCRQVVPAHPSPILRIDKAVFGSTGPAIDMRVERGGSKISAKLEIKSEETAVITIKRKESLGRLTVHLHLGSETICAQIDLENTVSEAFALWDNALQERKFKLARRLGNEYVSLLEIRTSEPGLVQSAMELQHSAAKGIGAAIGAVERSAIVKHVKSRREALEAAQQHVAQTSLALIYNAQEHISKSVKQAKDRANEVAGKAVADASKALQVVQASIRDLSGFKGVWPNKMTKTLQEAQERAQKLVKTSRLRGK